MSNRSYKTGKFISKREKQTIDRVPFVMFGIVCAMLFTAWGTVALQAKVETWTDATIARQNALQSTVEPVEMMYVEVQDTTCNMDSVDIAMWYMTNQDLLLHTTGVENQAEVLEASNQMTRDIIYCAELINNK